MDDSPEQQPAPSSAQSDVTEDSGADSKQAGDRKPASVNGSSTPPEPLSFMPPGFELNSRRPGRSRSIHDEPLSPDEQPLSDDDLDAEEFADEDAHARAFLAGGAFATVAIDRYDDLPAIFGKIDSAPSPRVALVAARGNRELQRALSMRRLQRHLDLTGKDLILVTRSRALRLRAREEALPAVGSLRRVNFHTYGRDGLRLGPLTIPLPSLGAIVGLMVLVATLLGAAAVVFWFLPKAEVTVFLPATAGQDTFDIVLDGQATVVNVETGTIPARRREVLVTRSIFRAATGIAQIPSDHAAVALRFTNRTNAPLVVPKGTVAVANGGIRFTVANDVDLPRPNASGDVVALAQQPGVAGNVPPNSIVTVEGDLAGRVAVTNPAPGEKGTDTPTQVVSEADVEGVRQFVEPILIDAAVQDLLLRFAESSTVFGASARVEIIEVKPSPAVNFPAKYADVQVTGRVSVLTAEDVDLQQLYVSRFRPLIPPDAMLLEDQFTTTVLRTGELEPESDRLPVTIEARALTAPFVDRAALEESLTGESKKGVEAIVGGIVNSPVPPLVKLSPGWVPRLPRRADRIEVTFVPSPP
ncbi:MAG: baseplate J/gp47 family protein [Dehalococcoidia bacterium]